MSFKEWINKQENKFPYVITGNEDLANAINSKLLVIYDQQTKIDKLEKQLEEAENETLKKIDSVINGLSLLCASEIEEIFNNKFEPIKLIEIVKTTGGLRGRLHWFSNLDNNRKIKVMEYFKSKESNENQARFKR